MPLQNLHLEYSRFGKTFLTIGFMKEDRIKKKKERNFSKSTAPPEWDENIFVFQETARTSDITQEFEWQKFNLHNMKPEDIPKELLFVYGNEMQKRIKLLNYLREVSYTYMEAGNRRLNSEHLEIRVCSRPGM